MDYLAHQDDGLDPKTHFIHIASPTGVRIVGSLLGKGETNQRHTFLQAGVKVSEFPWGQFVPVEEAIIMLNTRFEHTADRDRLVQLIGTMKLEEEVALEDDGFSQTVTAKSATHTARLESVTVGSPFMLAPFRSFIEVAPPSSPFILRIRKGRDTALVALFEADGGRWIPETVSRIREWLEGKVEEFQIIG